VCIFLSPSLLCSHLVASFEMVHGESLTCRV
jgi:hypothetical protein